MRPVLPSSLSIYASSVNSTISADWMNDSYVFDHLTENDLDCGDAFWRKSCTADFCIAQKLATEKSGRVMSIPYLFSAFLSPLFGHVVDKIGRRAILAVVSCVLLVSVHLSLAWMHSSPVIPLVGQGLAYVGYAAVIWPSVPLTVRKESVGTAFGAMTAIQNVGLALFPLVIACVYKGSSDRYIPNVEYFSVICALVGVVIGILLNVLDKKREGILNKIDV
jgi:Major Facilitator Superfamily.